MTTSRSMKRASPGSRPSTFDAHRFTFRNPRFFCGAGMLMTGQGWHCTSGRIPFSLSVRQTNRNGPVMFRETIEYRRFT